jgi:hypothetical protein
MKPLRVIPLIALAFVIRLMVAGAQADDVGLVGYWKLQGDCQDYSGQKNHGRNHGVDLEAGTFDGRGAYIEVPDAKSLGFDGNDFTVAAEVHTAADLTDFFGDILAKFDPALRRGFHLSLNGNTSGYNAQSNSRHLVFGIDQASAGSWTSHGRPGGKTHICDALTVFQGDLFAGTTDGANEEDWAHVFRYHDGAWIDCGRLGKDRTRGVYAMVVHNGELYAATSASHGAQSADMSYGRVYRYIGEKNWEDLGQPGEYYRLNSLASDNGKL